MGQRKGLPGGFPEAIYVIQIRAESREVVVGPKQEMWAGFVELKDLNWLGPRAEVGETILAQLRHRAPATPAEVVELTPDTIRLELKEPQFAVTPGQSCVLFTRDRVRGGGRIL